MPSTATLRKLRRGREQQVMGEQAALKVPRGQAGVIGQRGQNLFCRSC